MTQILSRIAVLSLATSAAVASSCRSTATDGFSDSDRNAVQALEDSFTRLIMKGDAKGLAEHYYTADAVVMPPNESTVVGRGSIEALFASWPPVNDVVLDIREIDGVGDLAYSTGRYSMTVLVPGAAPIHDKGKFLDIARRQSDGSWKVTRDIFNSDLPVGVK